ncbi:hypothetical protein Bca101_081840 [Brassica carinata]
MVLPNCCHAMCIKCYRNWNTKSESCPFCRGSIKRRSRRRICYGSISTSIACLKIIRKLSSWATTST